MTSVDARYLADLREIHDALQEVLNAKQLMEAKGLHPSALLSEARQVDNDVLRLVGQAMMR